MSEKKIAVVTGGARGIGKAIALELAKAGNLVVINYNGSEEKARETKALLEKQISSSVRWQQSVENMIRQGVDTFIEIGPGRTLAGFMRKIDRNVKVYNIQTVEDAEKVCQELV